MSAMLGDDEGLWRGQVEHLPGAVARGHGRRQRRPAACAGLGIVIDDGVRRLHLTQGLAWVPLLAAGGLTRRLAQAPDPSRLLQPIARRRLAAVRTSVNDFGDIVINIAPIGVGLVVAFDHLLTFFPAVGL